MIKTPCALIFDVFGTLVDWRSSVAGEAATWFEARHIALDPFVFADQWRAEYVPAMAKIRTGQRPYVALDILHRENLLQVLRLHALDGSFDDEEITRLASAWERLSPWPDVVQGLARLKQNHIIAPCSNGSIALMTRLAKFAGLPWDCILGADIARTYKPEPRVYAAACEALRLEPGEVMMVAAHNDDLAHARNSGLMTAFLPRPNEHGPGQTLDLVSQQDWDIIAKNLIDLASTLNPASC